MVFGTVKPFTVKEIVQIMPIVLETKTKMNADAGLDSNGILEQHYVKQHVALEQEK